MEKIFENKENVENLSNKYGLKISVYQGTNGSIVKISDNDSKGIATLSTYHNELIIGRNKSSYKMNFLTKIISLTDEVYQGEDYLVTIKTIGIDKYDVDKTVCYLISKWFVERSCSDNKKGDRIFFKMSNECTFYLIKRDIIFYEISAKKQLDESVFCKLNNKKRSEFIDPLKECEVIAALHYLYFYSYKEIADIYNNNLYEESDIEVLLNTFKSIRYGGSDLQNLIKTFDKNTDLYYMMKELTA